MRANINSPSVRNVIKILKGLKTASRPINCLHRLFFEIWNDKSGEAKLFGLPRSNPRFDESDDKKPRATSNNICAVNLAAPVMQDDNAAALY